jgi:hypothetical protein
MKPQEIIEQCDEQIFIAGKKADILLLIRGRLSKSNKRKMCKEKDAPVGEIIYSSFGGYLHVMFNAVEVKSFIINKMLNDL